jgi:hypothetical protein
LRHGYLWRPNYSFGSSVEHKVQPVKAVSVEAAQFPLLQPPKVDDSAPEVKPSLQLVCFYYFCFVVYL